MGSERVQKKGGEGGKVGTEEGVEEEVRRY